MAPVPEEYMKYQLHLNTGMEMEQIDQWFMDRRARQSAVKEIKSELLEPLRMSCAPCGAVGVTLVSIVFQLPSSLAIWYNKLISSCAMSSVELLSWFAPPVGGDGWSPHRHLFQITVVW